MVPLLVWGIFLPTGFHRGAAGGRRRGSAVFLLQLHRVLLDGAPPAEAPAQPHAPHAAAAAAPRTGAAKPPGLPAATPGNTRQHIRRKRKRRKRRVRRRRVEEGAKRDFLKWEPLNVRGERKLEGSGRDEEEEENIPRKLCRQIADQSCLRTGVKRDMKGGRGDVKSRQQV